MEYEKDSFKRLIDDVELIYQQIHDLRFELMELKQEIEIINKKEAQYNSNTSSTPKPLSPTSPTDNTTHNYPLYPLKPINMPISIGNRGVSTDRQTDRQTDKNPGFEPNSIKNALEILDSLDNIKKEIRIKFKKLTDQEVLVFSAIYQMDEEEGYSDYKHLSDKLHLTESSIRDYVGRIIRKGIPVDKKRVNNKNIQLSISKDLKKIVSLATILQLRDL
jgi:hypothetical protein